jgi:hypothetical protein
MLTVKQVHLSGIETIRLAKHVEFEPEAIQKSSETPCPSGNRILITLPDGGGETLYGGTVFVMNDVGKTVSRYDLGASMVPLFHADPHMTAKHDPRYPDAVTAARI